MPPLSIDDGCLRLSVLPEAGASMISLETRLGGGSGEWVEIMRPTPAAAVAAGNSSLFANFALLPWSNRVRDAHFSFEGREIRLRANTGDGHAIHGDVRKRPWKTIESTPARLRFTLESRDFADVNFPFPFAASLDYTVAGGTLEMRLGVVNRGGSAMPAGLGFHPYFRRALRPVGDRARLDFRATGLYRGLLPVTAAGPVGEGFDFSTTRPFGDATFDHCYAGWDGRATIAWPDSRITATIDASEPFRHLVLYVPPGEDFFAVEPVSNANDGFNLFAAGVAGSGVRVLLPGESLAGTVRIVVEVPA
ncbi:MAG: hypothetical protein RL698_2492 [Pseudomonadota bacterium]